MGDASQVSTSGNFACDPRLLCRSSRAAFFALNLGLLAACAQLPDGRVVSTGPDVMDRVRSLDLLPRFPQQGASAGQSGVGANAKAQVYPGVTIPAVEGVELQDDDPALPIEKETPETILIDRASERIMQEAIEELAVPYREVLLLCDVEEMSYQEIAATLGIPIGTVMSRLSRGRGALRAAVKLKMKGSSS